MAGSIQNTVILAKVETTSGTDAAPTNTLRRGAHPRQRPDGQDRPEKMAAPSCAAPSARPTCCPTPAAAASPSPSNCKAPAPWAPRAAVGRSAHRLRLLRDRHRQRPRRLPAASASPRPSPSGPTSTASSRNLPTAPEPSACPFKVGEIPTANFTFTGLVGSVAANAAPSRPSARGFARRPSALPTPPKIKLGGTYSAGDLSGGTDYDFQEFTADIANDVQDLELTTAETVAVYGRNPSAKLVADLGASAIVTQYTDMNAGTVRASASCTAPAPATRCSFTHRWASSPASTTACKATSSSTAWTSPCNPPAHSTTASHRRHLTWIARRRRPHVRRRPQPHLRKRRCAHRARRGRAYHAARHLAPPRAQGPACLDRAPVQAAAARRGQACHARRCRLPRRSHRRMVRGRGRQRCAGRLQPKPWPRCSTPIRPRAANSSTPTEGTDRKPRKN